MALRQVGFDPPPTVAAKHAEILDEATGRVLWEKNGRARIPIASVTKIMTALVALERADPAQPLTVAPGDLIGEASMGLRPGETLTLESLLHGLLIASGNDAALTIARGLGARGMGPAPADDAAVARFVGWMNERAAGLGLYDTRFANPHGLDEAGHYSSAYDLALLTARAWRQPLFARIFGTTSYQEAGRALRHGNRLIGRHEGVVGGKTGLTDGCGYCLMTAAERDGRRLVVVLLRDTKERWFEDTAGLLEWAYAEPRLAAPPPDPRAGSPAATAAPPIKTVEIGPAATPDAAAATCRCSARRPRAAATRPACA